MRHRMLLFLAIVLGIPILGAVAVNLAGQIRNADQSITILGTAVSEYQDGKITVRVDEKSDLAAQFQELTLSVAPSDVNFGSINGRTVEVTCTVKTKDRSLENCIFEPAKDSPYPFWDGTYSRAVLFGKITQPPAKNLLEMNLYNDSVLAAKGRTLKIQTTSQFTGMENVRVGDEIQIECKLLKKSHTVLTCWFVQFLPK